MTHRTVGLRLFSIEVSRCSRAGWKDVSEHWIGEADPLVRRGRPAGTDIRERKRPVHSPGVALVACSRRCSVQCRRPDAANGGGHQPVRIRRRNHAAPYRESEGSIVLLEGMGQQNPARGKGPCFVRATEARRVMEIAEWLSTSREGLAPFYSAPHPAPLPRGERKKGRGYIYYRSA